MSIQTNRLGKGLDALIPSVIPNTQLNIEQLPIHNILPNPFQPRKEFNADSLSELAHSIKQHGLAQPIIVRKVSNTYELIVGERRLEACKLNHFETIPAIVKEITDKQSCEIALVENIDRENLNVIEIALSLKRLMDEFSYTQETLSTLFSRSRSSIANILRLLKLPTSIQTLIAKGQLTEGHARALIEFSEDEALCLQLSDDILTKKLSVQKQKNLQKHLKNLLNNQPNNSTFLTTILKNYLKNSTQT